MPQKDAFLIYSFFSMPPPPNRGQMITISFVSVSMVSCLSAIKVNFFLCGEMLFSYLYVHQILIKNVTKKEFQLKVHFQRKSNQILLLALIIICIISVLTQMHSINIIWLYDLIVIKIFRISRKEQRKGLIASKYRILLS